MNAQQTQWSTGRVWRAMAQAVAATGSVLRPGARKSSTIIVSQQSVEQYDQTRLMQAEELFVSALCDDSNMEVDWLWLATKVVREHERRYCYERVLLINPDNNVARRALKQLRNTPAHLRRQGGYA